MLNVSNSEFNGKGIQMKGSALFIFLVMAMAFWMLPDYQLIVLLIGVPGTLYLMLRKEEQKAEEEDLAEQIRTKTINKRNQRLAKQGIWICRECDTANPTGRVDCKGCGSIQ